jgi:hypothetical protein
MCKRMGNRERNFSRSEDYLDSPEGEPLKLVSFLDLN